LIVCGDDMLAFRVAQELTTRYRERVTAILPSKRRGQGPQIDRLPGTRIVEQDELTSQAFTDAQITSARALALLRQDDVGNFHAALRARELNPDIRLVLAVFSPGLGEQVRSFFPDCAVLVGTSMSAPSFVAAALGEPAPSHVRVSGQTLYVTLRGAADPAQVLCGLATTTSTGPLLLPPDGKNADDLVLAIADGTPRDPLRRRDPLGAVRRRLRTLLWHKLGLGFASLFAVLVAGFILLLAATGYPWTTALYLTMLDAAGAALTNPAAGGAEKVAQILLTFDGLVFVPFVTALVVGARLTGSIRARPPATSGHVIVVGLGNVGTLVVAQLHDLGVPVVAIDRDPKGPGVALARRLGVPVVIGEIHREETLRAASLLSSIALVSVTSSDEVNLEAALHARALRADLRIVLRLYDDDLAERVQKMIGNTVSRSVSYLAAPAFAAAMLEHQVLRTIPVGRHVLLVADVQVEADAELAGQPIEAAQHPGQAHILAVRRHGTEYFDWSPAPTYQIEPQDRLLVLATRAGLGQTLARNAPLTPSGGATPLDPPLPAAMLSDRVTTPRCKRQTIQIPAYRDTRRKTPVRGIAGRGPVALRSGQIFRLVLLSQMGIEKREVTTRIFPIRMAAREPTSASGGQDVPSFSRRDDRERQRRSHHHGRRTQCGGRARRRVAYRRPGPARAGRICTDHISALGGQCRLDDKSQRRRLAGLCLCLRRPCSATGRHVGIPEQERIRIDRVRLVRRFLDRARTLGAARGSHPASGRTSGRLCGTNGQRPRLDPAGLGHLQHLHAADQRADDLRGVRGVPDPGDHRSHLVHRLLHREQRHHQARRLHRSGHRAGRLVHLGGRGGQRIGRPAQAAGRPGADPLIRSGSLR
jgi:Trk K+ transport system NAD-binding subunit